MGMHYNWSKLDGYPCPVKIAIGQRGIGKTFGKIKSCTEDVAIKLKKKERSKFIYVVETGEMVVELTKNNGEKFWIALLNYYEKCDTSRKRYFYELLTELKVTEDDEEGIIKKRKINAKVRGGTIFINGETAGYIVDMNAFGELKRNNFDGVDYVIIDEFISETLDKTSLENPKKISSIIQTIGRLRNIKIYMMANTVRQDDPILARMGFKLEKYGIYKIYDNEGLFAVLDFINPADYPEFNEKHNASVAGRFAKMLGETNEEENKFKADLPKSRRLVIPCKYKKSGFSCNIVRDNIIITVKQLENGDIACVPFAKHPTSSLYCLTEKEQGYKLGYHIICNKALRQTLMNFLRADVIYYYSEIEYNQLKLIIKGD